jgi:hypothetical protein
MVEQRRHDIAGCAIDHSILLQPLRETLVRQTSA